MKNPYLGQKVTVVLALLLTNILLRTRLNRTTGMSNFAIVRKLLFVNAVHVINLSVVLGVVRNLD